MEECPGELSLEECQRKYPGGNVQEEMSGECPRVFRDNRVGINTLKVSECK